MRNVCEKLLLGPVFLVNFTGVLQGLGLLDLLGPCLQVVLGVASFQTT